VVGVGAVSGARRAGAARGTAAVGHGIVGGRGPSAVAGRRPRPPGPAPSEGPVSDFFGRPLRDLRISVTDRCNFRCGYCVPPTGPVRSRPQDEILSFEEIERVARLFVELGVRKIRLTGGEPLLRHRLDELVGRLVVLAGLEDVGLTTNGFLLAAQAARLRGAGLRRLTVSLDALEDATFRRLAGVDVPVSTVLRGIDAAIAAGFGPIKLNTVVLRGANEDQVLPLARFARERGLTIRFIEYMDVGPANGWRREDVVSAAEILARISGEWPVGPAFRGRDGEVAERHRYLDGAGELGVIASVTRPFCAGCSRVRLTADGRLFTCLFGASAVDLRSLLRGGARDDELAGAIVSAWRRRNDRYSELRAALPPSDAPREAMTIIGG
jgi:cyclic pyranopterin phosphate synthase